MYGQEKGWKLLYTRYLETSNLPTHIKPQTRKSAANGTVLPLSKSYSLPSTPETKPKSFKPTHNLLEITPRMISKQLEVKPFKVLKAALDVLRDDGLNILPQLDAQLAPKHVQQIFRLFERQIPSREVWDKLKAGS